MFSRRLEKQHRLTSFHGFVRLDRPAMTLPSRPRYSSRPSPRHRGSVPPFAVICHFPAQGPEKVGRRFGRCLTRSWCTPTIARPARATIAHVGIASERNETPFGRRTAARQRSVEVQESCCARNDVLAVRIPGFGKDGFSGGVAFEHQLVVAGAWLPGYPGCLDRYSHTAIAQAVKKGGTFAAYTIPVRSRVRWSICGQPVRRCLSISAINADLGRETLSD